VVVVVTHAVFIEGRGAGGLDAPDYAFFHEDTDSIINRLPGNCAYLGTHIFGDGIRGGVWLRGHRPQHRQPLRRHRETVFAEGV